MPSLSERWRAARLGALQVGAFARAMLGEKLKPPTPAKRDGHETVLGLEAPIEILRDDAGVPHCFARNAADALFALGYVQAQDRLWHMEFGRRAAAGRMAEVVGPPGLPSDRLIRTVGIQRVAAEAWATTDAAMIEALEPYVLGVNAAIERTPRPREVRILDFEIEPWRGEDSTAWSKLVAFLLSPAWEAQLTRARLLESTDLDGLLLLDPPGASAGPVVAPPGAPYGELAGEFQETVHEIRRAVGWGEPGSGSNNWAVAPAHCAGEEALLACDPHLTPQLPPHGYFVHLDCPEFAVAGASIPGLPGVIWGANRHCAWGATAGLATTQELFVEEFNESGDYREADGWAPPRLIEETISVRSYPSETIRVRETARGPIVSGLVPAAGAALALRSAVLDPTHSGGALLGMPRAKSWDEFRAAVAEFQGYNLFFAYADVEGHIGMQMSGAVPRRTPGDGWLPAPGWDPSRVPSGYVPRDELPSVFDPPDGFVWSANNTPGPAQTLPFSGEFLDPGRAQRIGEMLHARAPHSTETARVMQTDRVSPPMRRFAAHLAKIEPANAVDAQVLRLVEAWDGSMAPGSPAAAVVGASFSRLLDLVLRARLGSAARGYMGSVHSIENLNVIAARTAALLADLLDRTPAGWFGSTSENIDGRGAWHAALTRAFREASELLSDRFGADPARWDWGACRPLTLQHGLSESPVLARLFNQGPFPFGGDANCPLQSGAIGLDPLRPATATPALRIVARMTSPPQLSFTLAGEQTTEPRPAYSLLADWRAGRLRSLPWERAAVEAAAAERLTLSPAGGPDDLDTLTPNGLD